MWWIRSGIEILRSRRSLAVVAGMKKKRITTQNRQNVERYKTKQKPNNSRNEVIGCYHSQTILES